MCPELQRRRTEERLQGFRIHRRSAPPLSPPHLLLRLNTLPYSSKPLCMLLNFYSISDLFHPFSHFTCFFLLSLSLLPQCVCTLSPSPSKQSKPTPLDSLQLPLAPGFVTHTVSLCRPLTAETNIHHQGFSFILEGVGAPQLLI